MKNKTIKTIGIVALSGKCNKDNVLSAKHNLEKLGFNVKLASNIFDEKRYLAGTESNKLKGFYELIQDDEIDLIMAARGGYGVIRLINQIDYKIVKSNPKPICGFSDVTALLLMIYKQTGLVTYHGPMLISDFCTPNDFTTENFLKALNEQKLEFEGVKVLKNGVAEGVIWGGNLSTIVSLCGVDFIPDKDFILFAEDLNEPVYKIDKMFTQLFNIPKLKNNCKGLVLGDFLNVDSIEWLDELLGEFEIPTATGFKITHEQEKITIPIGKRAKLNGNILFC